MAAQSQRFQTLPATSLPSSNLYGGHTVKQGSKDEVKGKIEEVKGKVKEKVGRATNNPRLEDEGTDQKVAGKIQKKVGQVEKVFED